MRITSAAGMRTTGNRILQHSLAWMMRLGQSQNAGQQRLRSKSMKKKPHQSRAPTEKSLDAALDRWRQAMHNMTQYDHLRQIALYLLILG